MICKLVAKLEATHAGLTDFKWQFAEITSICKLLCPKVLLNSYNGTIRMNYESRASSESSVRLSGREPRVVTKA